MDEGGSDITPTEWLQRPVQLIELERANTYHQDPLHQGSSSRERQLAKPFSFLNSEWEAMKSRIEPGDELWEFDSPAETWTALCGRSGVALVRAGKVVEVLVTEMN